jgi:hypothetical protein
MEGSQVTTTRTHQALEVAVRYLFSGTLMKVWNRSNKIILLLVPKCVEKLSKHTAY